MRYREIIQTDFDTFHALADAYYREGEDADTSAEEVDGFIRFLFDKVLSGEIRGCFALEGEAHIGFALWAADTEDSVFSQMLGFGTIAEIGLLPAFRRNGRGGEFVRYIEGCMTDAGIEQCYVSAYGPAQKFWQRCGYVPNGRTAANGLPIMTKHI